MKDGLMNKYLSKLFSVNYRAMERQIQFLIMRTELV